LGRTPGGSAYYQTSRLGFNDVKLIREFVDSVLQRTLPHLQDASPEQIRTAYGFLSSVVKTLGIPMPRELDSRFVTNFASIVARALINTPYGRPLELDCPLVVTLSVTAFCPFSCTNCYSDSRNLLPDQRALDRTRLSIEKILLSQIPIVVITGGEPLSTPITRSCVAAAADAGKWVFVSTNASIENHLELIDRYSNNLVFVLPIWGRREQHNKLRGARSFERVERNLELLNSRGQRGHLFVVLSETDLGIFDEVDRLVRKFAIAHVRVVRKIGVGRQSRSAIELDSVIVQALRSRLRSLKPFVEWIMVDIPELRDHRNKSALQSILGIPSYTSCAAGRWMMHLDSSGGAYSCFSVEGTGARSVASGLTISEQWQQVKGEVQYLSKGEMCIGESASKRHG
jgi:MoaA/NifB/PqqE/SkfB family radical SAM enzyme